VTAGRSRPVEGVQLDVGGGPDGRRARHVAQQRDLPEVGALASRFGGRPSTKTSTSPDETT
jgi:hypothetical protein